jgi:hypothetical protein
MGIIDWEGNRESFPNNIGEVGSSGSAMVDYALVIIVVFFVLFCKPGGCSEMCLSSEGLYMTLIAQ